MADEQHFLAELARIFDDEDGGNHQQVLNSALTQQQPAPTQAAKRQLVSKDSSNLDDPFLLPGDEHTWNLEDWSWDPFNLEAAPKDQAQQTTACCQALKRRRLPSAMQPMLAGKTSSATPDVHALNSSGQAATQFPLGAFNVGRASSTLPSGAVAPNMNSLASLPSFQPAAAASAPQAGSNCCRFQLPSLHMPTLPNSDDGRASQPGVGNANGNAFGNLQFPLNSTGLSQGLFSGAPGNALLQGMQMPGGPAWNPTAQGSLGSHGLGNLLGGASNPMLAAAAAAAAASASLASLNAAAAAAASNGSALPGSAGGLPDMSSMLQMFSGVPQGMVPTASCSTPPPVLPNMLNSGATTAANNLQQATAAWAAIQQQQQQQQQSQGVSAASGPARQASAQQQVEVVNRSSSMSGNSNDRAQQAVAAAAQQAGTAAAAATANAAAAPVAIKPSPSITTRGQAAAAAASANAPADKDEGADSDSDVEGGNANTSTNAGAAGRKQPVLQPATYTGPMEDVVQLTDTCEEGCRMQCQVAGCGKDLSNLKEYHQRYRICEVHIKLPQVLKDGRLQRFCQQCGRFHELAAFDAGRKSCREQLSKHNARRRRRAQMESQKAKALEQLTAVMPMAAASLTAATAGAAAGGTGDPPGGGAAVAGIDPGAGDVGRLLSALMQNPAQLAALRMLLGVQTHPALPVLLPFSPEPMNPAALLTPSAASMDPPTFGLARDMLDSKGPWAPEFDSDHKALRISMKLFNRTPADLPPDLRSQLSSWLNTMPTGITGAIRPGCVFLTLQLLLNKATYKSAIERGLTSLLRHLRNATDCQLWHEGVYAVQLGREMALVVHGKVTAYYQQPRQLPSGTAHDSDASNPVPKEGVVIEAATPSTALCAAGNTTGEGGCCHAGHALSQPDRSYPSLNSVEPLCLLVPHASGTAQGAADTVVQSVTMKLTGSNLGHADVELVVRQRGIQLRLPIRRDFDVDNTMHEDGDGNTDKAVYTVEIPILSASASSADAVNNKAITTGIAWLEVARGAWMSEAKPVLILDDASVAHEIQQLCPSAADEDSTITARTACVSAADRDSLLIDVDLVLSHVIGGSGPCFDGLDHSIISQKARKLLLFACDMGWAALAARVLPLSCADCACAAAVVAAIHANSNPPQDARIDAARMHMERVHAIVSAAAEADRELQPNYSARRAVTAAPSSDSSSTHFSRVSTADNLSPDHSHHHHHHHHHHHPHRVPSNISDAHSAGVSMTTSGVAQQQQQRPPHSMSVDGQPRGLSLLHRVVRSGNLTLLQGMLHWGAVTGYAWRADRNGPGGITPLHLAALHEDPRLLLALLDYAPADAFTCLQANDGTTPFHLSFQMGHFSLDNLTLLLLREKLLNKGSGRAVAQQQHMQGVAAQPSSARGGGAAGRKQCGKPVLEVTNQGTEVHPCDKCHCTLPPLLLSIQAACVTCGENTPCLGKLPAAAATAKESSANVAATGNKPYQGAVGHDSSQCGGCTTASQQAQHEQHASQHQQAQHGPKSSATVYCTGEALIGRKRALSALSAPAKHPHAIPPLFACADSANNTVGMQQHMHSSDPNNHNNSAAAPVGDGPKKQKTASKGAAYDEDSDGESNMCWHSHGQVYSITALCQGCHTNRVLEVV